jgi:hypothetical protein
MPPPPPNLQPEHRAQHDDGPVRHKVSAAKGPSASGIGEHSPKSKGTEAASGLDTTACKQEDHLVRNAAIAAGAFAALLVVFIAIPELMRDTWESHNAGRISAELEEAGRLQQSDPSAALKVYDEVLAGAKQHKITDERLSKKLADAESSRTALYQQAQEKMRAQEAERQRQSAEAIAEAEKREGEANPTMVLLRQVQEKIRAEDADADLRIEEQGRKNAAKRAEAESRATAVATVFWLAVIGLIGLAIGVAVYRLRTWTPEQWAAFKEARRVEQLGRPNRALFCPHCQATGFVRAKPIVQKQGISGAKATGALLTGGVSMLATGLSRKENKTQAHCDKCGSTWVF